MQMLAMDDFVNTSQQRQQHVQIDRPNNQPSAQQRRRNVEVFKIKHKEIKQQLQRPQDDDSSLHSTASLFDNTTMDAAGVQMLTDDHPSGETSRIKSQQVPMIRPVTPQTFRAHNSPSEHHTPLAGKKENGLSKHYMQGMMNDLDQDFQQIMQGEDKFDSGAMDDEDFDGRDEQPSSPMEGYDDMEGTQTLRHIYRHESYPASHGRDRLQPDEKMPIRNRPHQDHSTQSLLKPVRPMSEFRGRYGEPEHTPGCRFDGAPPTSKRSQILATPAASGQRPLPSLLSGQQIFMRADHINENGKRNTNIQQVHDEPRQRHHRSGSNTPENIRYDDAHGVSAIELDYDLKRLEAMPFEILHKEPFDGEKQSFADADKLKEHLIHGRKLNDQEQRNLFDTLSIEDWEKAGEWFVSEFSTLMQAMMEARRSKRELVKTYEAKIAERQSSVDTKENQIKRALGNMKQGGQGLLRSDSSEQRIAPSGIGQEEGEATV